MVDQSTLTPTQIQNRIKRNCIAREHRHRHCLLACQLQTEENNENQPPHLTTAILDHPPPFELPKNSTLHPSQQNDLTQQPQVLIHPSLEITLCPSVVINLDDDEETTKN